jgi:hypothetical protein
VCGVHAAALALAGFHSPVILSASRNCASGDKLENARSLFNAFIEALYRAFEQEQEPTDLTIGNVLVDFVPLSKLMGESMTALRTWAKGRARPATTPVAELTTRRIAA